MSNLRSRRWGLPAVVLLCVVGLSLAACGSSNDSKDSASTPVVRVGLICGLMYPIAMPAIQTKSFSNVTIEKQCFSSGAAAVQSLLGGSTDVYMGSVEHAITTHSKGLDSKIYMVGSTYPLYALVVPASSPVTSIGDLKGEKVGVAAEGSLADTIVTAGVLRAGLSKTSVTRVGLGAGVTMVEALKNGSVAAGMLPEPLLSQQVNTGSYKIVWEPEFPYMSLTAIARASWVADHEAGMKAFLAGLDAFAQRADFEQAASESLRTEGFKVDDAILDAATKRLASYIPKSLKVDQNVYDESAKVLVETGRLKAQEVPKFDEITDFSLLPK